MRRGGIFKHILHFHMHADLLLLLTNHITVRLTDPNQSVQPDQTLFWKLIQQHWFSGMLMDNMVWGSIRKTSLAWTASVMLTVLCHKTSRGWCGFVKRKWCFSFEGGYCGQHSWVWPRASEKRTWGFQSSEEVKGESVMVEGKEEYVEEGKMTERGREQHATANREAGNVIENKCLWSA